MNAHVQRSSSSPALQPTMWRQHLHPARMFGVQAWWSVTLHPTEQARRGKTQLRCLRRLSVVDVLLSLPIGCSVAEDSLTAREQRILAGLPQSVIERTGGAVVRRARPPLQVDHALVSARNFRRGLEAASTFSMYSAHSMVLADGTEFAATDLAEAGYYGVGVYMAGDRLTELVAPERLPVWPETAASWVFSEQLSDRLTQTIEQRP